MNYFYKCDVSSPVGVNLGKFLSFALEVEERAEEYARSVGASAYICPVGCFAGGVDFLEFDVQPDLNVWRKRTDLGDNILYEPNCNMNFCVMVMDDDKSMPSDTWRRFYNHKHLTWDEVRGLFSVDKWLAICNRKSTGNKGTDWNIVTSLLFEKFFVTYVDYEYDNHRNVTKRLASAFRKAVKAERMRIALPVLQMKPLYDILCVDTPTQHTPTLFIYNNEIFVGSDVPCAASDLFVISASQYEEYKNAALSGTGCSV